MIRKINTRRVYEIFLLALVGLIILSCQPNENKKELLNQALLQELEGRRVLLPNGWSLTPPKNSQLLGDLPLNLQISPSGRLAAVTNNGISSQTIMLIDVKNEKLLDQINIPKSWFGLKFSQDERRLYASGGNDNMIRIYAIEQNHLSFQDSIVLGTPWPNKIGVSGIELNEPAHQLYAVTEEDSALYIVDLDHYTSQKVSLPGEAYTCLLGKERNELYISLWGGRKVAVFNLSTNEIEEFIEVESHPNDMVITKNGRYLFVANANSNSVSLIDLEKRKVIETIGSALFPDAPAGSTPNGLALSEDESQLYIANADNNCLAVYDITGIGQSKSLGFIPTGWYPTSVKVIKNKIFVSNGKGERSLANPNGPNPYVKQNDSTQYIARIFTGTLSIISTPDKRDLRTYTKAVYANTPYNKEIEKLADGIEGNPIPRNPEGESPIKYVFYIIKENRTYDQVFGDISKGNGDPDLCLFPADITPNHHKLANEFVLFDNFYVDAEVSADGHNWCAAAYATDYVEKSWPTTYGGKGGSWNFYGDGDISLPEKGYIWDYCQRAGVSYRNYGELILYKKHAMHKSLEGHFCVDYPRSMTVMDTFRFHIWKQDFDSLLAIDQVPRLNTLSLGNDHTMGAKIGFPTPKSMLADNDLALGKLVEHISHSRIWGESVIFIMEDDAQNGPDHVDAHRSVLLIASPYSKRNYLDHTMYSTASVLRTIELILGLPPMSQYDAAATPLFRSFSREIDLSPYQTMDNSYPLDELYTKHDELSELTETFNLEVEDAAPDLALNEVIWKTVKGIDSEMPAPRRGAFIRVIGGKGD